MGTQGGQHVGKRHHDPAVIAHSDLLNHSDANDF